MSGGNKPYYDRDDLDEDEKKLFDAMVLEEMEKLERQFESSSTENEGRNQKPPIQNPHQENGNESRSRHGNSSHQSNSTTAENVSLSSGQPTRRAPRISLVSENFNRSNPILAQNNGNPPPSGQSATEKRNAQQDFSRPLGDSPRLHNEVQEQQNIPRRARRDESPPESRTENNIISRIGAKDSTMVSNTQKRAQQAEYAMQLAQSSNQSQIGNCGLGYDDGSRSKPRRRPSGGIEDINIISNIGQDSQQLKDRKKSQQLEYAQQLQSQQQQKQRRDSTPSSPRNSNTPRIQGASIYNSQDSPTNSIRSDNKNNDGSSNKNFYNDNIHNRNSDKNDNNYDNNNNIVHSKNSVVNFGADPNLEALKKKEMKIAYAKQLQEQKLSLQNGRSKVTSDSGSGSQFQQGRNSENGNGSNYNSNTSQSEFLKSNKDTIFDDDMKRSGKNEDDKNILNAAMIKRSQQKKYFDDITSAAAAPPIMSARIPLRGSGAGSGIGGQQQRIEDQGTGLQIGGGTSSFLSNADAERLESKSRKVQLQQMYAKQLSDDASVGGGGGERGRGGNGQYTNRSDNNYVNDNSSNNNSRRGSGRLVDGYQLNEGFHDNDNSSRISEMSSPTGDSISGSSHLIFGAMSERDQVSLANAKKKAAQQEYYQQLKEVDNKRLDSINSPLPSTRITLYRNREQRDHDDFITGGRDRENSKSLRSQDNHQRDFNDSQNSQNYQGYNYNNKNNSDSGIGSRSQSQSDMGYDDISTRRREEDDYNNNKGNDHEISSNSELYNSQRSSVYDRNDTGDRNEYRSGDGDRDKNKDMVSSSRYSGGESESEPEMRSDSRSQKFRNRVSDRSDSKDENEKYRYEERVSDRNQSKYLDRSDRDSQYSPSSGPPQHQGQYSSNSNRQNNENRNSGGHSSSRRGSAQIENYGRRGYDDDNDNSDNPNRYEDGRRTQMSSPDTNHNQEYDDGDNNDSQYHGSDHESYKRQQYPQQQQQQYSREEDHGSNNSRHQLGNQGTNGPRSHSAQQFPPESSSVPVGKVKGRGRSSGGGESSISIYG